MTPSKQRLIELLREKSVRTGQFTLSSGKTSDLYVDVKQTSLHAEGSWLIAALMLEKLKPEVTAVGGLTLGADPIACAIAPWGWVSGRKVNAFIIRKEAKGHGTSAFVEGMSNLEAGAPVAIVEDTTTTGGSLWKAVERARGAGLNVVQCLTVVDRQEGAAEFLRDQGYVLEALATRAELLG